MSIVGRSQQTVAGFDPGSLGGLMLWLDAADSNTITMSGSNVSQWLDKSKNGYTMNAAPTGCALPIRGSNLNGLGTVGIDTTSTAIKQSTVLDGIKNFFWVRKERVGNQGYMCYFGADSTYDFHTGDQLQFAHGGFAPQGVRDASLTMFTSNGVTTGTLVSTAMPGANVVNLVSVSNMTGSTRMQGLSYDRGPTRSATCDWGEVLLYSNALTFVQAQAVEGYLAWKWGLTSYLPSNHPYKTTRPVFRTFLPSDIGGCALWLDAADESSFTLSGSNITQWRDKSSNAYTGTASGSPTRALDGGYWAVTFNGTDQYFNFGDSADLGSANLNVFVVSKFNNPTGSGSLIAKTIQADAVYRWSLYRDTGRMYLSIQGDTGSGGASYTDSNTTRRLLSGTWDRANLVLYQNGVSAVASTYSNTSTFNSTYNLLVGAYNNSAGGLPPANGFYLNGSIHEIVCIFGMMTAAERQQMEGYLAERWGLRGSMGGIAHPYRYQSWPGLPTQFSGCALWLDAADESSFTLSGSNVTQWRDKSSNAYTGTASGTPTRALDGGYWAVRFNGTDQYFNFGDSADLGSANLNLFVVSRFNNPTGSGSLIAKSAAADAIYRWMLYRDGGSLTLAAQGGTLGSVGGASYADSNTTRRLLSGTWDRATLTLYQNGVSAVASTYSNTSTLNSTYNLLVGAYNNSAGALPPAGGFYLNGSIHEIVCIFGTMTAAERQQIEGYLAWKWGTSTLLPGTSNHFTKLYRSLTPVFTPLQASGLTLWLDAADTGTQTFSGTSLTQWTDKSGMGYTMNTAPTGNVLPVRGNAINGLSTIGITTNSMAIKQSNVINGVKNIFWIQRVTGGNAGYQFYFGADGTYDFHTGDQGQFAHGGFSPQGVRDASVSLFLSGGVTTGTMSTVQYPGGNTLHMLSVSNMTGDTRLQGLNYDRGGGTRSIRCEWGELLLYTTAVPAADIKRIEGYLAWKWGMTAYLPSNHPFKRIKP